MRVIAKNRRCSTVNCSPHRRRDFSVLVWPEHSASRSFGARWCVRVSVRVCDWDEDDVLALRFEIIISEGRIRAPTN